jgi:hypothetical protein
MWGQRELLTVVELRRHCYESTHCVIAIINLLLLVYLCRNFSLKLLDIIRSLLLDVLLHSINVNPAGYTGVSRLAVGMWEIKVVMNIYVEIVWNTAT